MKSNANGLMGDLESIKALLEEDDDLPSWDIATEPVQEAPINEVSFTEPEPPLLDAWAEPEPTTHSAAPESPDDLSLPPAPPAEASAETDATTAATTISASAASLDALLDTDFHAATATVMARARGLIEQHPNQWSPQQTDELSDALRVRIDGAVQEWISLSLAAHAGELQQRLLQAVRDELARHLEAFETASDPTQT